MRELFAHSVHSLILGLVLISILSFSGTSAPALPRPIGNVSDYGNVLNRYGRDEISSLIKSARTRYGIEVYILASWDDPYHDINRYAVAILNAWGIATGRTLLAVFVRTGLDWNVRVIAGTALATAVPGIASYVQTSITDLVAHRRVQEAMAAIFPAINRRFSGVTTAASTGHSHVGRIIAVVLVVLGLSGAAFFVHRRVCPRCGHILRVRRTRGLYGREDVVYYCPHCHYTRTKRERARGPRR